MTTDSRAEAAYLREPDPTPDDYCDWCEGSPCVCDAVTNAAMDDIYERSAS